MRRFTRLPARLAFLVLLIGQVVACASAEVEKNGNPSLLRFVGIDDGDVLSGVVAVEIDVSRAGDVRGVEFYVDDERIDTVILAPYVASIDTTAFGDGDRILRAVAAQSAAVSHEVSVTVRFDNAGPTIRLLEPAEGSGLFFDGSGVSLIFDVDDPSGVVDMAVSVNGLPVTVDGPPYLAEFTLDNLSITSDQLPLDLVVSATALDGLFQQSTRTFNFTLRSRLAWSFRTLDEIWAPPAVGADGTAYFGSLDSTLYAVSTNGSEVWQYPAGGQIVTSPTLTSDGLVLVSAGSSVHAVNIATQVPLWVRDLGNIVGTSPTVGQDAVYVGTYGNALVALSRDNGLDLWTFPTSDSIQSTPIIDPFGIIVFGSHDNHVYGVDSGGAEFWRYRTGGPVWSDPIITADSDVLVGSHDGYLYRLSRYGAWRWEFDARGQIWGTPYEGADGTIYVGSTFRRLYALTPDGTQKWQVDVSGIGDAQPQVAKDGTVFLAATDGLVHAFSSSGGVEWTYNTGGTVIGSARLSPDESLLFVGTNDRSMYALHTGLVGCASPEMVRVDEALVMRYEASRPDATNDREGVGSDTVCSRPNVLPWTNVTWQEARAACQSAGLDLCLGGDWEKACLGPGGADFPYGNEANATACNGWDHPVGGCDIGLCRALPTASNTLCESDKGTYDASGNVREWTLNDNGAGMYIVRGGGFQDQGDDLRCSNVYPETHVLSGNTSTGDVGFRCCSAQ